MPATGHQQALVKGRVDRLAEVHTRLGAPRAFADPGNGIEANHEDGAAISLTQTSGDDPDHTGMPFVARHNDDRVISAPLPVDQLHRLVEHHSLDLLAGSVEGVELFGER